ncbi:hypothetical protein [uncultured Meiothermus sp.]|jgi:hypothetical protein|uniref:hypothetical protein n=1 Tax=uncultured Meiothermus sp. TaxID=157471 RepID=UPI002607F2E0|nr:hypothetical protein [uncultured Meiothermus sp.]
MQTIISLHKETQPPLELSLEWLPKLDLLQLRLHPRMRLRITFGEDSFDFAYVYRPDWTTRSFEAALEHANAVPSAYPMVVLPYLSDEKLKLLAAAQVSGLDLCGNALILVPGRWLLRYSGRPNRFKNPQSLKDPYRGKSAMVARALLERPAFRTVQDLHRYILERGGELSQPLVSRSLEQLRQDVVVGSQGPYRIYLLQPERLLDRLVEGWGRVRAKTLWRGRVRHSDLLPVLFANARRKGVRIAVTGAGSASRHAGNLTGGTLIQLYAEGVEALIGGLETIHEDPFPNLELRSPPDPSVFFDLEPGSDGTLWASAVQTYLELHWGDARQKEGAARLRVDILGQARQRLGEIT